MSVPLSRAERDRLIRILGLLGSDHGGERDAAGLAASRMLRARGITWSDVIAEPAGTPRQAVTPCRQREAELLLVRAHWRLLTAWERTFIDSVEARWQWTPRQKITFAEILSKVRTAAPGGRP